MAWFTRFTRFGDMHMVFGQEQGISCGVACVIMAAFKINKFIPGRRALYTEADILAKATAVLGPNPLGGAGLGNQQILRVLNHADLRMTGWQYSRLTPTDVPGQIIRRVGVTGGIGPTVDVNPIIVGIDWTRGGGHWVLIDTVRTFSGRRYATVCDPWDANVHIVRIEERQTFSYTGRPAVAVDLWGTHYRYNNPSVGGAFLGDIVWRP